MEFAATFERRYKAVTNKDHRFASRFYLQRRHATRCMLRNTEIYINIEQTLFEPGSDAFTVKVAETPSEVKALLEVGFEYVCQKDGLVFLRKRK